MTCQQSSKLYDFMELKLLAKIEKLVNESCIYGSEHLYLQTLMQLEWVLVRLALNPTIRSLLNDTDFRIT